MTRRRIVITGASGFVGQHVVVAFLDGQSHVVLAMRDASSCPEAWSSHPQITIIETGPIQTASNLEHLMAGTDVVVHLAALAHTLSMPERDFMASNSAATERLCHAAAEARVKSFIHLSSIAAITGNVSDDVVDDDTVASPTTAYGRSKLAAETHVAALARDGIFAISLRPPLIVGAGAKGNWGALQRLAAGGFPLPFASVRNRRSMLDVDYLANAIVALGTGEWSSDLSGNYAIANRDAVSLSQMLSALRQGMGMPARLFPVPPALLAAPLRLSGRSRMADGLLGSLELDGSRFRETFNLDEQRSLLDAMRNSGPDYASNTASVR